MVYRNDYARAGFRTLSVADEKGNKTAWQVLLYSTALVPASVLPTAFAILGRTYAAGALVLSFCSMVLGIRLFLRPENRIARTGIPMVDSILASPRRAHGGRPPLASRAESVPEHPLTIRYSRWWNTWLIRPIHSIRSSRTLNPSVSSLLSSLTTRRRPGHWAALIAGGLPCAEITFRTDAARDAIAVMHQEHPEIFVGAGTVLTVQQAQQALDAGASFIVAPGLNPSGRFLLRGTE